MAIEDILRGAAVGAKVGTGISPGIGTGIGALAGGLGMGLVSGATDEYGDLEKKRLEDLLKRQRLGQLGYSAEEIANMEGATIDPAKAQLTEARQRGEAERASFDIGAGTYARAQEIQTETEADVMNKLRQDLETRKLEEKSREEEELNRLVSEEADAEEAKRAAIIEATLGIGGAVLESKAFLDEEAALADLMSSENFPKLQGLLQGRNVDLTGIPPEQFRAFMSAYLPGGLGSINLGGE
tara:strand:- start:414 stop:1136 length:723 start_codon:yes stop_codon:yes gene_type:complete